MKTPEQALDGREEEQCETLTRVDLAALYRVFAHYGWVDLTYTHISARVPGEVDCYLINPYGLLFEEITASSLVKVSFEGTAVDHNYPYNRAGHLIHSAVLQARPEVNFVLHSHTREGAAVSAMQCGLLPLSEQALAVLGTLAYHSYAVLEEDREECDRLIQDLGDKYLMLMRNHGLLVCGRTAGEAFLYHYFLQTACEIQVAILGSGQNYHQPSEDAVKKLAAWGAPRSKPWGEKQWSAMRRLLDRKDPLFSL
jgi:ribulose-5-phosphate 4-epimerase/fuculose-1-phosphate aldolase